MNKNMLLMVIIAGFLLQIGLVNADCYNTTSNLTTPFLPPVSHPNLPTDATLRGERILIGANNLHLTGLQKYPTSVGYGFIVATNTTILASSNLVGEVATFDLILYNNTEYNLYFNDSTYWTMQTSSPPYPVSANGYTVKSVVQATRSGFPNSVQYQDLDLWINVYAIITQDIIPCSSPTETTLLLNGNNTNITLDNSTALNITAYTNITGLNANITLNGTLLSVNQNITYLNAGLYEIFAQWIGNTTYSQSNKTLWANITYTPIVINYTSPYPVNTTWNYCSDNQTLLEHHAVYNNGSYVYANDSYIICADGCTLNKCNNSPMVEGFYGFLILIGIVILVLFFDRYVLRGRR